MLPDNNNFLEILLKSINDKIDHLHTDIEKLDAKLDNYQERLIKVEQASGAVRHVLMAIMGLGSSLVTYILYKYIDLFKK